MKGRLRDFEEKAKKTENRSWDNLGTGKRLNLGSSRHIIKDDDNHFDTSEHGNEEPTQVDNEDSNPIFPRISFKPIFTLKPWLTITKRGINA